MKRLVRSKSDRQIAGVCSGLAQYFNVDPTIIRLIFVVATLFGGPGLLVYIILAIAIPEERGDEGYVEKSKNEDTV
jgi:phage shock protein C